jgi:hypothetical protein
VSHAHQEAKEDGEKGQEPSLQAVRKDDPRPRRMVDRTGGKASLLAGSPRRHARQAEVVVNLEADTTHHPNMGDLIVVLLASSLAALRDRLAEDGYEDAALLVADLVDIADGYITNCVGTMERSQ